MVTDVVLKLFAKEIVAVFLGEASLKAGIRTHID